MILSKRNLYKLIYMLIFLPFLARFLTDNFGMTYAIMPVFDGFEIFILALSYYLVRNKNPEMHLVEIWFVLFLIVCIISIFVNGGTTLINLYYSVRPYFRLVIAILISSIVFDLKNTEKLFKYIEYLLYINVIIMTFEYIFMGLRQDIIGGTFGNSQGCNAIQNILCIFVFCVTVEMFLKKMVSKRKLICNVIVVFYVAILAEITVLFFECVMVTIMLIMFEQSRINRVSKRKLFLICAGILGSAIAVVLYMKFNPDRTFLFSINNILEYLGFNEGSTGVYRISRMKVFSQLGNVFFKNNILKWMFGYGLGNCSTHSYFYNMYQNLQYTFFSSSNIFLETGLSGVFVNLGILITGLLLSVRGKKYVTDVKIKAWMNISCTMTVIMVVMFFYNTTLRDTYTAFLSGTILAIPYIVLKSAKN